MRRTLFLVWAVVVAMGATSSGACTPAAAPEAKPTIRLAMQPLISPAWVLRQQRTLEEKYGYKVEWVDASNAAAVMEALAANATDFGEGGSAPLIQGRAAGGDFWAIADFAGGVALAVAKSGSGINKLEDLRGKKIAYPGNGTWQYVLLQLAFKKGGFTEKDVSLYKSAFPDMPLLLEKGAVDAFMGVDPFGSLLEVKGAGKVIFKADDVLPGKKEGHGLSGYVVVRKEYAIKYPQAVSDFLKASQEAINWMNADTQRAAKFFETEVFKGGVPAAAVEHSLRNKYIVYFNDITPDPANTVDVVQRMNEFELTKISNAAAFAKDFVHPEFAKKAFGR